MYKLYFLFFISAFTFSLNAQEWKEVNISFIKQANGIDAYVENGTYSTISVRLSGELINMTATPEMPVKVVLKPKEKIKITRLKAKKKGIRWNYNMSVEYLGGNLSFFDHNREYLYRLPYKEGESYPIMQSCQTTWTHRHGQNYAIDFDMPEGTPIYAARDGRVAYVKTDTKKNGNKEDLTEYTNYIRIEHEDFTIADYAHLRHNGAVVKPGEIVKRGQLIGYSGSTGCTEPHLHFAIIIPSPNYEPQSLPIIWIDKEGKHIECPQEGSRLVAGE